MPSHGREMRQNINEYISKLFVRQQMKDESWESTIQSQKKNVFSFWKTLLLFFSLVSLHPHICSHLLCTHFLTGKHQTIFTAGTNICSKRLRGNTFLVMLLLYWVSLLYMQVWVHMCPRLRLSKILMQESHSTEVINPPNV